MQSNYATLSADGQTMNLAVPGLEQRGDLEVTLSVRWFEFTLVFAAGLQNQIR